MSFAVPCFRLSHRLFAAKINIIPENTKAFRFFLLRPKSFLLRSKPQKGAFFGAKRCLLYALEKASIFMHIRARTHARTLNFFQQNICTSATARCKPLPYREIDRCRYGDNSDRYADFWHQNLHFFEEKR